MKQTLQIITICLFSLFYSNLFAANHCRMGEAPEVIHPMENWDVISGNTATIKAGGSFSGIDLTYKVYAKNNPQNRVKINPKTGTVNITGATRDAFDVKVVAMNYCGQTPMTFNVTISEEK